MIAISVLLFVLLFASGVQARESLSNLRSDVDQNSADIATAQATADAAQTSADAAQVSADNAQTSADAAQTSADNAQTTADAAQASADANSGDIAANTGDIATNVSDISTNSDAISALETRVGWLETYIFSVTKTAFVTKDTYQGDLLGEAQAAFGDCAGVSTGMEGADCICQETADAAGLDGTYLAWIATTTDDDPEARFTQSSQPYVMPDLTIIADDWADLTDGTLNATLRIAEDGSSTNSPTLAWTKVREDGGWFQNTVADCADWTSASGSDTGAIGRTNHSDTEWTNPASGIACSNHVRLYCFEQ